MSILLLISLFAAQNCTAGDALTPEQEEVLAQKLAGIEATQKQHLADIENLQKEIVSRKNEIESVETAFARLLKRIDAAKNDGNTNL